MKKRVIALCLAFVFCFCCLGLNVFAENSAVLSTFLPQNLGSMENFIEFEDDVLADADAFKSDILKQLSACSTSLNVSKYKIPVGKFKILTSYILYSLPECFNIDIEQTVSGTQSGGYVLSLKFGYNCTASQYKEMFSLFTEKADAIIGDIANDSLLEDYQKALIIHDRIVVSTDYVANTVHSFDAYGALINHQAVCQGYSLAYKYLLNKIGIETYLCNSDTLNHVWNIVKIGGKYYHVDCTWDDPTNTPTGSVYHNNFLVSTDTLKTNHPANDFDTTPVSTDFDDSFWRDSYSEFVYLDGNIYYVLKASGKILL